MRKLLILGAGGHGKVVLDIAMKTGVYDEIAFADDADTGIVDGIKTVATISEIVSNLPKWKGYEIVLAIGSSAIREKLAASFENAVFATLIHPSAVVADSASIGAGTVVMANTVINSGAVIGDHCIINTGAIVEHDNKIGNYSHISVGARLGGTVKIGKHTWVGIGAVVSNNLSVCDGCLIGAGTVVVRNIEESGTYVGAPARKIK